MIFCPACNGTEFEDLGSIPRSNLFAGRTLGHLLPGASLYRCARCLLGFREPRISKAELDDLYRQGSAVAWTGTAAQRVDWSLARSAIDVHWHGGAEILDIGCFDGSFLAGTPAKRRFGVEISEEGIRRAKQRGVEILGRDFGCVTEQDRTFDVITAFDVIEHVEDPRSLFQLLAAKLSPGGMLIVSTGDLDAPSWRLARSRYWYCALPEHISFLSRRWFESTAAEVCLQIISTRAFSHGSRSFVRRAKEAFLNSIYLLAPGVIRYARIFGAGERDTSEHVELLNFPPSWMTARDHVLVVMRHWQGD